MATQATQELSNRLIQLYGTDDYAVVVSTWQSNPASVPAGGEWGITHAATTLLELEIRRGLGTSNSDLISFGNEQIARWYVREYLARCDNVDPVGTMNPLTWDQPAPALEDSRLDYWTPRVFIEWYVAQL